MSGDERCRHEEEEQEFATARWTGTQIQAWTVKISQAKPKPVADGSNFQREYDITETNKESNYSILGYKQQISTKFKTHLPVHLDRLEPKICSAYRLLHLSD